MSTRTQTDYWILLWRGAVCDVCLVNLLVLHAVNWVEGVRGTDTRLKSAHVMTLYFDVTTATRKTLAGWTRRSVQRQRDAQAVVYANFQFQGRLLWMYFKRPSFHLKQMNPTVAPDTLRRNSLIRKVPRTHVKPQITRKCYWRLVQLVSWLPTWYPGKQTHWFAAQMLLLTAAEQSTSVVQLSEMVPGKWSIKRNHGRIVRILHDVGFCAWNHYKNVEVTNSCAWTLHEQT